MKNYRKAKPGDVKCSDCVFKARVSLRPQLRCSIGHDLGGSHAVGKHNTCDKAEAAAQAAGEEP